MYQDTQLLGEPKTPTKNYTHVATAKTPTVSLMSLMDEEYAQKVSKTPSPKLTPVKNNNTPSFYEQKAHRPHPQHALYEEDATSPQPKRNNNSDVIDEDEELRLVLAMSAAEAQERETVLSVPDELPKTEEEILIEAHGLSIKDGVIIQDEEVVAQHQLDEDYAAALQLQADFESEELAHKIQSEQDIYEGVVKDSETRRRMERERRTIDPSSKVSSTYDPRYSERPLRDNEDDEGDYDSEEEKDEIMIYLEKIRRESGTEGSVVKENREWARNGAKGKSPSSNNIIMVTKHDPTIAAIKNARHIEKYMEAGSMKDIRVSNPVFNNLRQNVRKQRTRANKVRGNRMDVGTEEKVMDPRTKTIVFKMLNSGVFREIHGVVSAGKEANVYHALTGDYEGIENHVECAVKIFKTNMNEFKNRAEYLEGDFRFKNKKSQHNTRKLIKLWAEKETRNLKKMKSAGIDCPEPILLRENVLIMSFIGRDGFPAPRLRDVEVSVETWSEIYHTVLKIMRKMYHVCKLVHADLSEYNLMYRKKVLWVIDVAQAVDLDHPNALDFLKKDCVSMATFFSKRGVENVMSPRRLFNFVVDTAAQNVDIDEYITKIEQEISSSGGSLPIDEQLKEDAVFMQVYIPRNLSSIRPLPDGSVETVTEEHFHQVVTGLSADNILYGMLEDMKNRGEGGEEEEEEEDSDEEEEEDTE